MRALIAWVFAWEIHEFNLNIVLLCCLGWDDEENCGNFIFTRKGYSILMNWNLIYSVLVHLNMIQEDLNKTLEPSLKCTVMKQSKRPISNKLEGLNGLKDGL